MLCCWVEDPNSEAYKCHLPRIKDYLWIAEDGMKMQVYSTLNTLLYISKFKNVINICVIKVMLISGLQWLSIVGCCVCCSSNPCYQPC